MVEKHSNAGLFREILDRTPNGMLILRRSGQCIDANSAAAKLLGLPRRQMLYQKLWEFVAPPPRSNRSRFLRELLAATRREFEFRCTRPDGETVEIGALASGSFQRGKHVIVLHDITIRKRAEEAVRKQANMLDFANDTIMIRDLKDIITYWNRGAERLYGWSRAEAVGKYVHTFLNTVFPEPLENVLRICIREGRWQGILTHTKRDGSRVTVASRWTVERDEYGRPAAYLEINNDITEKMKAEEDLLKAHNELERRVVDRTRELSVANARLKALSARLISAQEEERLRISRELHDDLGQILTSTSLNLQRALKSDAPKKQDLVRQVLAANQEARNRLRELSSLLRPRVLDDVGLKEAIQTYVSDFEKHSGVRSRVSFRCRNEDLTDEASTNLYRILQEALTNISKYARANNVAVQLYRQNGDTILKIRDDGIGFNPASIRVDRTLGLHGMRERAELLGGEFRLTSAPGRGTEILVHFPLLGIGVRRKGAERD